MSGFVWVVLAFIGGLGVTVIGDMVSEEVRDRLDHIPHAILKLAARRLDTGQRSAIYEDEWLPELTYILKGAETRPITRLITGTHYALGILAHARRIARHLDRSAPARSALTGATMLAPAKAFHQLEQFVENHKIGRALLLHYSDNQSNCVLDAILRKQGVIAELFIQHEESSDAICGERQTDLIKSLIESLIRRTETVPSGSAFKIHRLRMPVSMRAILIDDKVLCAGWYTFRAEGRSGKLVLSNDLVTVAGENRPVLLAWSGTEDFEILRGMIESLAASYREHPSVEEIQM